MRLLRTIIAILLLSTLAIAQSGTTATSRVKSGTSDPASCQPTGINIFYRSDTGTLKVCTATNTWTASGASTNPAGSGSELQYRAGATSFGAVTGSSVSGAVITLTGVPVINISNAADNTVTDVLSALSNNSGGTPTVGFGVGILLRGTDNNNNIDNMLHLTGVWSDATSGSEDSDFVVELRTAGAAFAEKFRVSSLGAISLPKTVTAGGTTGAQTINKPTGSVNFAAAATSLVVTNSVVTTSSIIQCTVATNDATMKSAQCVASSGSFTIFANAAATAETRVNWSVTN